MQIVLGYDTLEEVRTLFREYADWRNWHHCPGDMRCSAGGFISRGKTAKQWAASHCVR